MLRPASMYDNVQPLPATLSSKHLLLQQQQQQQQHRGSPSNRSLRPPSHVPSLQDLSELRHGDIFFLN
uniref:Uncharacterized protein n=1 Tax=Panagrolaimus superbus TaxID=310955 RepID=A0A914YBP0_9BILA